MQHPNGSSPMSCREQLTGRDPRSECERRLFSGRIYSCFTLTASITSTALGPGELWLDEHPLPALPEPPPPPSISRVQYSLVSSGVSGRSNSRPSGSVSMSSRSLRVELEPPLLYGRLCMLSSPISSRSRGARPPPKPARHSRESCWCRCTSAYRLSRCFFDIRPNFTATETKCIIDLLSVTYNWFIYRRLSLDFFHSFKKKILFQIHAVLFLFIKESWKNASIKC